MKSDQGCQLSPTAELNKVQLIESFLLNHCLGTLELNCCAIDELAVCWNNTFWKIYQCNRLESVKLLQYFCGCLDFKRMHDIACYRFFINVSSKLPYLSLFYTQVLKASIVQLICCVSILLVLGNYSLC
jgi:hypothetical protein